MSKVERSGCDRSFISIGQTLRTKDSGTISSAPTALPKSTSFSSAKRRASPNFPSSISCWFRSSFIYSSCNSKGGLDKASGRCFARDRDGGFLADFVGADLHPVTCADLLEGVAVEAVHCGDLAGDGARDVDVVHVAADDAGRADLGHLALVVQAHRAQRRAGHGRVHHDLSLHALAVQRVLVGTDDSAVVGDRVVAPAESHLAHQSLAAGAPLGAGNALHDFHVFHLCLHVLSVAQINMPPFGEMTCPTR